MSLGTTEIILIVVVLLLLFSGRKIPQLMKGLGEGIREFKKVSQGDDEKMNHGALNHPAN